MNIGRLSNDNGEGNENVPNYQNEMRPFSFNFLRAYFGLREQIEFKFTWVQDGKAINSTISVRTWARSPLFSSIQIPFF